ncbi:tetratricopeptide repeat protein [Alkalicoccus luteus]|uniref:tetratricopeptide repeat protein n=1 Tax=Alkalicoccus luteus TaxID=1237094 RepID=UPI0040332CD7
MFKHLFNKREFREIISMKQEAFSSEDYFYVASSYDATGFEREAIDYYEKARALVIPAHVERNLYVQLGSSYRAIGEYESALSILNEGLSIYPNYKPLQLFLAMTYVNLKQENKSLEILLKLASHGEDYEEAIRFYSTRIHETW